jgi:hypothetical protein
MAIIKSVSYCWQRLRLTVEDTYEVDFQGHELGRNGLAVHHSQGSIANARRDFGDPRVRDLGLSKRDR